MLTYAFAMNKDSAFEEAIIIFQSQENDPPTRWHYFDTVKTTNALLIVDSLNENEKKNFPK